MLCFAWFNLREACLAVHHSFGGGGGRVVVVAVCVVCACVRACVCMRVGGGGGRGHELQWPLTLDEIPCCRTG